MKRTFIFFLVFMLVPAIALCSTTKVLDQDTDLRPQGWTAGALKFKQSSTVELNERGEVISGVLVYYLSLPPAGNGFIDFGARWWNAQPGYLAFKKGNLITFDEHGYVISGVLELDADIYLIPKKEPLVTFKSDTAISFDKNGNLIKGTLCNDTFLQPAGSTLFLPSGGLLKFKSKTEVVFGPNAQAIKGTIANDLTVNGRTYLAGTTLQFSESAYPQMI